jgi:hypothetical protein
MTAALDIRRLLTIDVDAEIRKLGRAPLGSVEQFPALLAARAIRSGARSIEVSLTPRQLEVRDDAGDLDAFRLADLAVLLEPERPPRDRHAALLALEAAGCTALLALASLPEASALSVESATAGITLEWRRGQRPRLRQRARATGTRVVVEGVRLSRSQVRSRLAETCRFATARVILDAEPLPRGFEGVLGETNLEDPLRGRVALPETAEGDAHVWLLVHGAVTAHTSLPCLPAFVAAVELGHLDATGEPAALRDALSPLAGPLAAQALALLLRLARRPSPNPAHATALRGHILRAARRSAGAHELRRLPCLPTVPAPGSAVRLLSIAELARHAGGGSVAALFPDQDPRDYRVPGDGPLLLLDAAERSRLDRLTGARFVAPPRRLRPSRLRRLFAALGRAPGRAWRYLRSQRPVRPLPERLWSREQRALVEAVRAALPASGPLSRVALCAGAGTPRSRGATFWLPQRSPEVVRAAAALAREGPGFAAVAALALLPPGDPPP